MSIVVTVKLIFAGTKTAVGGVAFGPQISRAAAGGASDKIQNNMTKLESVHSLAKDEIMSQEDTSE